MFTGHRTLFRTLLLGSSIALGTSIIVLPMRVAAQLSISVGIGPPEIPVYEQPPIPETGYIWTPGYWQWSADSGGYFWVPGTWVQPPEVGLLWTPPYWGWSDGAYLFHEGYWGQSVGYYGGVNYGFGYGGRGYQGGRWHDGGFEYNRSVNNFGSVEVHNSYDERVINQNRSRVSYVGGTGGLTRAPTAAERRADQEQHRPATSDQSRHIEAAAHTPALAQAQNHGRPAIAATARPAQFDGGDIRAARQAAVRPVSHEDAVRPQPHPEAAAQPHPVAHVEQPRPQPRPEAAPPPRPQPHAEPRAEERPAEEHERKP